MVLHTFQKCDCSVILAGKFIKSDSSNSKFHFLRKLPNSEINRRPWKFLFVYPHIGSLSRIFFIWVINLPFKFLLIFHLWKIGLIWVVILFQHTFRVVQNDLDFFHPGALNLFFLNFRLNQTKAQNIVHNW